MIITPAVQSCGSYGSAVSPQLSLVRGALPMFELVERQPSHFSNPDVLNLTPGEATSMGELRVSLSLWLSGNHVELHDDF